MNWDFNKQISTIIIIAIIMFGLFLIAMAIGTWTFSLEYRFKLVVLYLTMKMYLF